MSEPKKEQLSKNEQLIAELDRPTIKLIKKPQGTDAPQTTELIVYGKQYRDPKGNLLFHDNGDKVRDTYRCFLKEANRHIIEAALQEATPTQGSKGKPMAAGEIVLKSCWVDGNMEIQKIDHLFVGAALAAGKTVEIAETVLKKN